MSQQYSDTETSEINISTAFKKPSQQSNNTQKTKKKKNKNLKLKQLDKSLDNIETPRKLLKLQQAKNQTDKKTEVQKLQSKQIKVQINQNKNVSSIIKETVATTQAQNQTPTHTEIAQKTKKIYVSECCNHASVYQKLFVSIILSVVCSILFAKPPKIDYPLAQYEDGKHQGVFEIVTDRKSRIIKFNLEIDKKMGILPINSVKTARIKATVHYALGYKFESNAESYVYNEDKSNMKVQMSNLQILSYNISTPVLENKEDGLWNNWQYEDNEKLIKYIEQKYIKQMQKQILLSMKDEKKVLYENKAKFILGQILDQYETWFNWMLRRLDRYIDVGLQPYVKNYQIVMQQKQLK